MSCCGGCVEQQCRVGEDLLMTLTGSSRAFVHGGWKAIHQAQEPAGAANAACHMQPRPVTLSNTGRVSGFTRARSRTVQDRSELEVIG